jgi:hypothetical protein
MRAMPVAVFAAVGLVDSIKAVHSSWPLCQWISKLLVSGPDASIQDVHMHTASCTRIRHVQYNWQDILA